ncbi:MAG: RidA family protein [Proteobacteria bacterium]|nr:RidA family protein [Pseudomonadota bacterium]
MAESFNPGTVWRPFGTFSQVVMGGDGQVVYLKGQVSLDQEGNIVGHADMKTQVHQVLLNIEKLLASMNGKMSDIVSLTQYTTDIRQFMKAGPVRQQFFNEPFPVTTTVEVSSLYDPELLVEITAIVEIPKSRFSRPKNTTPLHD